MLSGGNTSHLGGQNALDHTILCVGGDFDNNELSGNFQMRGTSAHARLILKKKYSSIYYFVQLFILYIKKKNQEWSCKA